MKNVNGKRVLGWGIRTRSAGGSWTRMGIEEDGQHAFVLTSKMAATQFIKAMRRLRPNEQYKLVRIVAKPKPPAVDKLEQAIEAVKAVRANAVSADSSAGLPLKSYWTGQLHGLSNALDALEALR